MIGCLPKEGVGTEEVGWEPEKLYAGHISHHAGCACLKHVLQTSRQVQYTDRTSGGKCYPVLLIGSLLLLHFRHMDN